MPADRVIEDISSKQRAKVLDATSTQKKAVTASRQTEADLATEMAGMIDDDAPGDVDAEMLEAVKLELSTPSPAKAPQFEQAGHREEPSGLIFHSTPADGKPVELRT